MNKRTLVILTALTVISMALSACGATPTAASASVGAKVDASLVAFTGIVEAIGETEIIVDGQTIILTPEMIAAADFVVGDTVEVEAYVDDAGVVTAKYVELHNEDDYADDMSDSSSTDDYADDMGDSSSANETTLSGVVEVVDGDTFIIDGQIYQITAETEMTDLIVAGDFVSFEFVLNADNTLTLSEIELESEDSNDDMSDDMDDDSSDNDMDDSSDDDMDDDYDDDMDDDSDDSSDSDKDDDGDDDDKDDAELVS